MALSLWPELLPSTELATFNSQPNTPPFTSPQSRPAFAKQYRSHESKSIPSACSSLCLSCIGFLLLIISRLETDLIFSGVEHFIINYSRTTIFTLYSLSTPTPSTLNFDLPLSIHPPHSSQLSAVSRPFGATSASSLQSPAFHNGLASFIQSLHCLLLARSRSGAVTWSSLSLQRYNYSLVNTFKQPEHKYFLILNSTTPLTERKPNCPPSSLHLFSLHCYLQHIFGRQHMEDVLSPQLRE